MIADCVVSSALSVSLIRSSEGWNRTTDIQVMSLTSYRLLYLAVATVGFGPTRRKAEPYESSPMTNFGHVAMLDTDVLSFKLWCQLNLMRNIPSLLGHPHYSMA